MYVCLEAGQLLSFTRSEVQGHASPECIPTVVVWEAAALASSNDF